MKVENGSKNIFRNTETLGGVKMFEWLNILLLVMNVNTSNTVATVYENTVNSIIVYVEDFEMRYADFMFESHIKNIHRRKDLTPKEKFIFELEVTIAHVKRYYVPEDSVVQMLPEEVTIGQAIIETGFGVSYSAQKRNNYLGLTKDNGQHKIFNSMKECLIYYYDVIERLGAYEPLRVDLEKGERRTSVLIEHLDVYAEDPNYQKKILKVIHKWI